MRTPKKRASFLVRLCIYNAWPSVSKMYWMRETALGGSSLRLVTTYIAAGGRTLEVCVRNLIRCHVSPTTGAVWGQVCEMSL